MSLGLRIRCWAVVATVATAIGLGPAAWGTYTHDAGSPNSCAAGSCDSRLVP